MNINQGTSAMNANHLAIILWGLLTVIPTFAAALFMGSFWGMALAAAAAGLTYVFQVNEQRIAVNGITDSAAAVSIAIWVLVIQTTVGAWVILACA